MADSQPSNSDTELYQQAIISRLSKKKYTRIHATNSVSVSMQRPPQATKLIYTSYTWAWQAPYL